MTSDLRRGFRLDEYRVLPLEGTLDGPGGSQHLQPKVVEVLLRLAETPGRIVEREVLLEKVWGRTAVSDDVLTRCISELRHALDDQRGAPRFIQTVPKRGYRLIASVHPDEPTPTLDDPPEPTHPVARRGWAQFVHELARRRVMRAAGTYLVVSWATIEVAATVLPELGFEQWTKLVIVALALGFPAAIVLSWFFNFSLTGFEREDRAPAVERLSRSRADYVMLGAMLLFAGLIAYRSIIIEIDDENEDPPPNATEFESSIAVLPFNAIGGNPEDDNFGLGLANELVMSFSRLPELKVAAGASTYAYKNRSVDVATIAEQLQVERVLDGNVRRFGDMVRITVQLANAEGFNVWSETYDRRFEETLAVQLDITRRVVAAIADRLSADSAATLSREPTQSPAAYEAYIRGREELRRPKEKAMLASAVAHFERAVGLDPRYASAFAGLCDAHLAQYVLLKDTIFFEQAEKACHRALTLDRSLVEARLALGSLYRHSGQYDEALAELQAVAKSNPGIVQAYDELGATYRGMNRMQDAEDAYRQAVALEPSYWAVHKSLGNFLYRSGHYQDAAKSYQEVIRIAPDNASAYNNLGSAQYMLGNFEGAATAWERALALAPNRSTYLNQGASYFYVGQFNDSVAMYQAAIDLAPADFRTWGRMGVSLRHIPGAETRATQAFENCIRLARDVLAVNPDDVDALKFLSLCYTRVGQIKNGQDTLSHLFELQPDDPDVFFIAAIIYTAIGDQTAAIESLEKALKLGYSLHMVRADPDLADISSTSEFKRLLARAAGEESK